MSSLTVQEFMNQNPKKGRSSKLEPYKDDIFLLKNSGYSQPQILNFLQQNGVEVGLTTLKSFIKNRTSENEPVSRRKAVQVTNTTPTNAIERTEQITHQKENAPQPIESESQNNEIPKPQIKKGIKKFDWKNATTDGLI